MATTQDKEKEELKNKRLQLERRGDIELTLQLHFKLKFGFDKGKMYWKALNQEVMVNSIETIPGFNLNLLGIKPTYRKDEKDAGAIKGSKNPDIAVEGGCVLTAMNNALATIMKNKNSKIYKMLMSGVKGSLDASDKWKSHWRSRFNAQNESRELIIDDIMRFINENSEKNPDDTSTVVIEEPVEDVIDTENCDISFSNEPSEERDFFYDADTYDGDEKNYHYNNRESHESNERESNRPDRDSFSGNEKQNSRHDKEQHSSNESSGSKNDREDFNSHSFNGVRMEKEQNDIIQKEEPNPYTKYRKRRKQTNNPGNQVGNRFIYNQPFNSEVTSDSSDIHRMNFDNVTNTRSDGFGIRHNGGIMFESLKRDLELFDYINEASGSGTSGGGPSGSGTSGSSTSGSSTSGSGASNRLTTNPNTPVSNPHEFIGKYFKTKEGMYELICEYDEEDATTFNTMCVMQDESGKKSFLIKKVKDLPSDYIISEIQSQNTDQNKSDIINAIYTLYVKGDPAAPKIFGEVDTSYISEDDKKAVEQNTVKADSVFYKHVDMMMDTFKTNCTQSYKTVTEIDKGESVDMSVVSGKNTNDGNGNEDYWETDDIYGAAKERYQNIEMIKEKSYIEISVDDVKIKKTLKAEQFVEINDSKLGPSSKSVIYRLQGSQLGQDMRNNIESRETRININYVEFRATDAAAFLANIMPDLVFVTERVPNNTLGKLKNFAKRSGSSMISLGKQNKKQAMQKPDVAPFAKVKKAIKSK